MEVEKHVTSLDELIVMLGLEGEVDAQRDTWTGKRADPRFAYVIPVSVRRLGGARVGQTVVCRLWDISRSGMCITSYFSFEQGEELQVDLVLEGARWSGRVCVTHCTPTISGHRIGLRLSERADASGSSVRAARVLPEIERAAAVPRPTHTTWGMLSVPVRKLARQVAGEEIPGPAAAGDEANRRELQRLQTGIDTHLILVSSSGWHRVRAEIEDISQGGMRLRVHHQSADDADRSMSGSWTICVGMPIMVGFGREPDTVWVPAEIARCKPGEQGVTHLAAQFETPRAIAFAGGATGPGQ